MSSGRERINTRSLRRAQQVNNVNATPSEHQQSTVQTPMIDVDAIEDDDDDVVESTATAFNRAKRYKSRSARRGPLVVDVDSGISKNRTRLRSDQANVELNNSRKAKAVEEPKFNCPICMCPLTEEMTTKCGHIFCNKCIRNAISIQPKCPACRKKVTPKDLIRIFLPTTR
uniref:Putative SWI/SNF-related matrix-associated actin-dependent regulator of chromatin subfamily A member 3-like 1 n=1 Tax=Noccaea caerulescens TaxID=107243 RepID=A0A1J3DKP7_NOCCA